MGISIYSTGGETADVGDLVRTIIVDSTVVARVRRDEIISNHNIRAGDIIVGLSSSGQTIYEKELNSGMGSNGLTSARHDVFANYLAEKYPESYDPSLPGILVYSGKLKLTDKIKELNIDAGKLVLSPTRTYAPVIKKVLETMCKEIHGIIHCSGGGQTKILHLLIYLMLLKIICSLSLLLFRIIQEQSGTSWVEMYKVFNMGHRFEMYTNPENAEKIIKIAAGFKLDAKVIGHCEPSPAKKLNIIFRAWYF